MHINTPVVAIVENDDALLTAMERLLRAHRYPAALYSSAEAFLAATRDRPACLILDIRLGGMSGLDLHETLLAQGEAPPVIYITSENGQASRERAARLQCLAYITKPFTADTLMAAIAKALGHKPA